MSSPPRESLEQRLFSALDAERADAYRRVHLTVMLATRFAAPDVRRKGRCVTVLYLHALGEARSAGGREARWRRLVTTTASLGADLRRPCTAPHQATQHAQAELERIVAENDDLLDALPA